MTNLPISNSLSELCNNLKLHNYPCLKWHVDFIQTLVDDDADACICTTKRRIMLERRKYVTHGLLFNLCFYPNELNRSTKLEKTCGTKDCVNPKHHQLTRKKCTVVKRTQELPSITERELLELYPVYGVASADTAKNRRIDNAAK